MVVQKAFCTVLPSFATAVIKMGAIPMTAPVLGVGEITREKILAADPETARQLVGHMRVQHKALREYENLQRLSASKPHSKGTERPSPQATSPTKTSSSTGAGPDVPPWLLDDDDGSHSSSHPEH